MKRQNLRSGFHIQRLEDRRLLAADFAVVNLAPVETAEPDVCYVADLEVQSEVEDQAEVLDLDTTEVNVDVIDNETLEVDAEIDVVDDVDVEPDVDVHGESEAEIHDLGDPVDGVDGFFGSIDADSPSQAFNITPSESGMIDIVIASSFGDSETRMDVADANGDIVAATMAEELSGFQMLSFEAEAGETYQLNVSSEDGAVGYFQVTVDHNEIPEPIDWHADTIGEESTELQFVDGLTDVSGDLELEGDVDTFRFTADLSGKVSLGLAELNAENATELQIQVFGGDGEAITRGITNETVGISFDVQSGGEYFLSVSAGEGQTGSYLLDMNLEADVEDVVVDQPIDEVVNEVEDVVDQPVDDVDDETDVVVDEPVDEAEVVVDQPVDEVDDQATELEFVDGLATITGEVGAADGSGAYQFVAPVDGEAALALTAESEANAADASVAVFDANGEAVVDGTTNDDVGIVFDVVEGDSYQVKVDSINGVPASYELTLSIEVVESEGETDPIDEVDPVDDLVAIDQIEDSVEIDDVVEGDSIDDLVDEEMEVCFTDLQGENEFVDSFFAEFNPESIFTMEDGFELRRRG
jgi:hypothetical protein